MRCWKCKCKSLSGGADASPYLPVPRRHRALGLHALSISYDSTRMSAMTRGGQQRAGEGTRYDEGGASTTASMPARCLARGRGATTKNDSHLYHQTIQDDALKSGESDTRRTPWRRCCSCRFTLQSPRNPGSVGDGRKECFQKPRGEHQIRGLPEAWRSAEHSRRDVIDTVVVLDVLPGSSGSRGLGSIRTRPDDGGLYKRQIS